jgi:predicted nucleic acid-binding protein
MIIVLDAGPLGVLSNPSGHPEAMACQEWLERLDIGTVVYVSEIADYEVRRELIREDKAGGLARLDRLVEQLDFLAIDTRTMRRAAELWAEARKRGRPTADAAALDGDVILAAQAQLMGEVTGDQVVVATNNARHLAQFVDARPWREIEG